MRRRMIVALALMVVAAPLMAESTRKLLEDGVKLSDADAARLEQSLESSPSNHDARVRLLAYWTARPETFDPAIVKAARSRHITWMVQRWPQDEIFALSSRVTRIYTQGRWSDPESFAKIEKMWLAHARQNPVVASFAAEWIELGNPEEAERIYKSLASKENLGALYAEALLGLVAEDYLSGEPVATDAARAQSEFAAKARKELESSSDPDLLVAAAMALATKGGVLYADNHLDLDYTVLLKPLLAKARKARPNELELFTLSDPLPARGERPPRTIHVDSSTLARFAVHRSPPDWPAELRRTRIQGTVGLQILVGIDGRVLKVVAVSGPEPLRGPAMDTVRGWTYQPMSSAGKPVFVIAPTEITFTMN